MCIFKCTCKLLGILIPVVLSTALRFELVWTRLSLQTWIRHLPQSQHVEACYYCLELKSLYHCTNAFSNYSTWKVQSLIQLFQWFRHKMSYAFIHIILEQGSVVFQCFILVILLSRCKCLNASCLVSTKSPIVIIVVNCSHPALISKTCLSYTWLYQLCSVTLSTRPVSFCRVLCA